MTKRNLSDGVKLRYGIISQDTNVEERTIWWLGDNVREKLIGMWIKRNGTDSLGSLAKGIFFNVQKDVKRALNYAAIGGSFIDLPDNAAIITCGKTQATEAPFVETNPGQAAVYSGLEASDVGVTFWREGGNIYFKDLPFEVTEVLIVGIPSLAALDMDDTIPMADIKEDLVEMIVAKLFNRVPEDKDDDTRQSPE